MKERILLFIIVLGLTAFIYIFQSYTVWGLTLLVSLMALYALFTNIAYKICQSYRVNYPNEFEDIKQVALLGLWKACLNYDKNRGAISTYAYPIVKNHINIYVRGLRKHQNRYTSFSEPIKDNLTVEDIIASEIDYEEDIVDRAYVAEVTKKIPVVFTDEREQFIFKEYINGYTQAQTAQKMNLSQPQISRLQKRVKSKIYKLGGAYV